MMKKEEIQQQIELVKELYNSSFSDAQGNIKKAGFKIYFENRESGLKVGINHIAIHPGSTVKNILFALRSSLEEKKKTAEDATEVIQEQPKRNGMNYIQIEFRGKQYYYYPNDLEKVFRMDNSQLKSGPYTTALLNYIKEQEDESNKE